MSGRIRLSSPKKVVNSPCSGKEKPYQGGADLEEKKGWRGGKKDRNGREKEKNGDRDQ